VLYGNKEIERAIHSGRELRVDPFNSEFVSATGLDLTLGSSYREPEGSVTAIDCASVPENHTNLVTVPEGQSIIIEFVQDAAGNRTIAWPASFRWPNNTASSLSTAANRTDVLSAVWNGLVWKVALVPGFVP
jgi:hypothetical protein